MSDPLASLDFIDPVAADSWTVRPQRLGLLVMEGLLAQARHLVDTRQPNRLILQGLEAGAFTVRIGETVVCRLDPDLFDRADRPSVI